MRCLIISFLAASISLSTNAQQSSVQLTSENMAFFSVTIDGNRLAAEASVHQEITGLQEGKSYSLFIDYVSPEFTDVRTRLTLDQNGGRGAGIYSYTIPAFFQGQLRLETFVSTSGMGSGAANLGQMAQSVTQMAQDMSNAFGAGSNSRPQQAPPAAQPAVQPAAAQPSTLAPEPEVEIVYVEGYTGEIGCEKPVGAERFERMMERISDAAFADDKVSMAKQILRTNCIVIEQLVEILEEISFDDDQLDLAKFAYEHVYDLENYYEVYGVFSFSSSSDELDDFIEGQH
ncbi:MAG: DUF4476 domain-containing protein [Flavobacteriales bacterium]